MSQLNSRPTRSRRSSPFVSAQRNPNSSPATVADTGRKRTFMDKWTEPPIPAPMPSFAEAGMERHGVVANMAPLGTRPSAKAVKSSAKPEVPDASGGRPNGVAEAMDDSLPPSLSATPQAAPQEAMDTTEPNSNVSRRRSTSTKAEELEHVLPSTPQQPRSARKSVTRSSVAPPSVRNESEGPSIYATSPVQRTPLPNESPSTASYHAHKMSNYTYDERDEARQREGRARAVEAASRRKTARIVELAVSHAIEENRWCTAYALRELYDEDPENFGILVEKQVYEEATEEEIRDFYRLIGTKKKEGRKDKAAEYYFNGDGSDPAPHRPRRQVQQAPVQPVFHFAPIFEAKRTTYASPYAKAPAATTATTTYTSPYAQPPPPPSSTSTNKAPTVTTADSVRRSSDAKPASTSGSPRKLGDHGLYPNKKHKGNSFAAVNEDVNGKSDASATGPGIGNRTDGITKKQQNGVASASSSAVVLSSPLPKLSDRPRAVSISSSSSLSSVDEQILDNDEYDPMDFDHAQNHAGTAKPSDGFEQSKGQGIVRAGNANANAKFGASVSTETQSNAGGSINQKRPIKSKKLSRFESDTFSSTAKKTNNKSRSLNKSKTSSPAPPSFQAINIPTRSHNSSNNSNSRVDSDNNQANPSMAPELIRTSSSSSVGSVPILKPVVPKRPQIVFKSKKKTQAVDRPTYEESEMVGKWKRKAREITNGITEDLRTESFVRPDIQPRSVTPPNFRRPVEYASDGGDSVSIPTASVTASSRPSKTIRLGTKNDRASRRQTTTAPVNNYDSEMSSPTGLGFQPDLPPGSLPNSRAGTPSSNRPSRKAKNGTGLRVKTSPMKKKSGPSAGIPRASGERDSPVGGFYPNLQGGGTIGENDDYCAACGGNGKLLCCDGCTRSFHFKCVDLSPDSPTLTTEEWFCNECLAQSVPRSKDEEIGYFGPLLANMERKNPSAFHLPKAIREYFENVKTGTEGEYEEGVVQKPKNNRGYDEAPDYFKLKDSKGNPILCHGCHLSAVNPSRAIIPCTYCSLSWHLDCLDPPLAKEPPPGRSWRCPAHVDDLLEQVPGSLGPAHRFRKIKGASLIKPVLARGVRNNGHIEIENATSDDEDQGSGFYEQREYGHVYKLPEEGIKLDFISRVHREFGHYNQRSFANRRASIPKPRLQTTEFDSRSLDEQQAALNLAYLATANPTINLTQTLIDALISEADEPVIKLIAKGDASKLSKKKPLTQADKSSLVAMTAFLQERLASTSGDVEGDDGMIVDNEDDDL
ncbi:putative phd-finger domain-containing protein [Botrytis cinerea BcDW1]|uniref:Putative phd-finger domain-containing protein n=1 Tax=Botryotinia fuckeliana (strain BcDW1) TaxID=1290391 RepID=M7U398_BOTF1|nr:putative phd-finger domain-containing protein [Botrytis cinerea BcDW1]